ncbi:MAG: hypothetical protein EXR07_19825 [Acetobacteraceae bacterium]|nr:hypothetical protein [Acetobacteraceae bacterium]
MFGVLHEPYEIRRHGRGAIGAGAGRVILYWTTLFLVAFLWTFGIGPQTKAVARSKYLPAAVMGVFLCGVQIFIVRAAVFENPWLFFAVGGTAYALDNVASIWVFDRMARPARV